MYNLTKSLVQLLVLATLISATACKTYHLADTEVTNLDTPDTYAEDQDIAKFIEPYRKEMEVEMNVVIGSLEEDLVKSKPNSNLGNWFCDILYVEANKMFFNEVDFTLQNYGGLRLPSISKGELTVGKIYELMPFDNMLVAMNVEGKVLKQLLDGIARYGGWPISHTLSFTIVDKKAEEIIINGEPFDISKTYRMAIPDYVANGGDSAEYLKDIAQENSGVFIRDIIVAHLETLQEEKLPITVDNSIRIKE